MPTRRTPRLCVRLLLAALLLLAQHGAWLHELGHVAAAHAQQQDGDVPHAPMDLCRLCLASAQIDAAATPHAPAALHLAESGHPLAIAPSRGEPSLPGPARRSRSPPPAA